MSRSNTVAKPKTAQLLEGVVRGFARTKADKDRLLAFDLTDKQVYLHGSNGENLQECLATFRSGPGWIVLAEDLRAFGECKKDVANQSIALETQNIRILNLANPEDVTYSAHVQRAQVKFSGARLQDKRAAKRVGRLGGIGKGAAAFAARIGEMSEKYIRRIVNHPALTWAIKAELLDGIGSISTLRRHFYTPEQ